MLAAAKQEHSDSTTVYGILAQETLKKIRADENAASDSLNRIYRSSILRMIDAYLFGSFSTENRSGIAGPSVESAQPPLEHEERATSEFICGAFARAHADAFPEQDKTEAMDIVRKVTMTFFSDERAEIGDDELQSTIRFFESLIENLASS